MPPKKAVATTIELPKLNLKRVDLKIVGDTPLVTHNWSEKAKQQMRDKQQKNATPMKEAKDPWQDFCDSMYWMSPKPKGRPTEAEVEAATFGVKAISFKDAAVTACSYVEGVTKVAARGTFHIMSELLAIQGDGPFMREDMTRIGIAQADLRYRGEFQNWSVVLPIRYNANVLSIEQVANLFNTAGFAVGVGEYRPEKNGQWGMFHVAGPGE